MTSRRFLSLTNKLGHVPSVHQAGLTPHWCVVLELRLPHKPGLQRAKNDHSAFITQRFLLYSLGLHGISIISNMSTFQDGRQLSFPAPLKTIFPGHAHSGLFASFHMTYFMFPPHLGPYTVNILWSIYDLQKCEIKENICLTREDYHLFCSTYYAACGS